MMIGKVQTVGKVQNEGKAQDVNDYQLISHISTKITLKT